MPTVYARVLSTSLLALALLAPVQAQRVPHASEVEVFDVAEVQPELIGGPSSITPEYPEFARRAGIEGRVIVQFVVDERGNVTDPVVVRSPNELLSEAALAEVQTLRFTPGQSGGRPVKVRFSLPVTFRLRDGLAGPILPMPGPPSPERARRPPPPPPPTAPTPTSASPLLSPEHTGSDFREVRWGDLRRAVRQTERGRPTVPYPGTIEFRARVFDRSAKVLYTFAGDVLKRAGYQFDTETRGGTESLFDDLHELLTSKYGEPSECGSDNGGTRYSDADDTRSCEWKGGRTEISLGTHHDPDLDPGWHFLLVTYSAVASAPILEAGARVEAPALFGAQVMTDGATALYGLDWGASEAVVRQRLGRAVDARDDGTGRLVLFQAPTVAEYEGTVLATFYDGGLQSLLATYESDYLYAEDGEFFVAMARAALGAPESEGPSIVRWRNDRATFALGYASAGAYEPGSVSVLATAAGASDAEARDRQRHADDF